MYSVRVSVMEYKCIVLTFYVYNNLTLYFTNLYLLFAFTSILPYFLSVYIYICFVFVCFTFICFTLCIYVTLITFIFTLLS